MESRLPKVSVILITYQEKFKWLKQAIDSILAQEGVELQIVMATVVDDPAIDVALSRGLQVYASEQAGIYKQINGAIPSVTGDWFVLEGGNDVLLPTKFIHEVERCLQLDKKVCYSDWYDADGELEGRRSRPCVEYSYTAHMTVGNIVPDNAMVHRSLLDKYAPFDERWGNLAFYDFWLRIAEGEGEDIFTHNPLPEWIYRHNRKARHHVRKRDVSAHKRHLAYITELQTYHGKAK